MIVLSISSGNRLDGDISPIVKAQNRSLQQTGLDIDTYAIVGKGLLGYLKNVYPLYKYLQKNEIDLIHAHYSLCGFVGYFATFLYRLSGKKRLPMVVSLMGSDVKSSCLWRGIIAFFVKHFWSVTIVKSEDMKRSLGIKSLQVIPNGVDLELFDQRDKGACRKKLAWEQDVPHILFGSNPNRDVKNYPLAKRAFDLLLKNNLHLQEANCQLKSLKSAPHDSIPIYLNACDVLLLTSKWEGSPNIIKEAMACGTPIVCTDVGDVRWLLSGLDGCFITNNTPEDIALKLKHALQYDSKTKGRARLQELCLDAKLVAERLLGIYEGIRFKY
ncbi:MAG TPA: glycosyltransferase family 4 protein [Candidatus Cloacimonetes bacterium]|jgi:glycosyltransferase involved in cell wall biosynthesis|nr:glycosyltransferase family 4 protein [Candidatus Cloacimonadota bacterium]